VSEDFVRDAVAWPPAWLVTTAYEMVSAQLCYARAATDSEAIRGALAVFEVAQPPSPDDPAASVGCWFSQLEAIARSWGMSEAEHAELRQIASRTGMTRRHAAVCLGTAVQRGQEIKTLENLYQQPAV
jgi:hypothetical protein